MNVKGLCIGCVLGILVFGPLRAQERTETVADPEDYTVPESFAERVRGEGEVRELSLRDAIRMALANNLEIEIENYNEDLNREWIFATRGFYDPILRFTLGWNSAERPNTSILDAGRGIPTRIFKNWNSAMEVQQNVTGGGRLTLSWDNSRSSTNSAFSFINPQFGSNFGVSFTQPLWRGFRETPTERQLKLYNLDTEITDSQFKQRVSEIVQQVENQYWELVYAIENYETRRRSMELAIIQYRNNRKRVEIGVMAPIEITASRAEVATREQEMIQSEVQIINAQNALKRLLAPDPGASLWDITLIPTDWPRLQALQISLQEAIETSLRRRPELEQVRLELEKNEVERTYLKNQGKPAVDLIAGVTSTGTAGQVLSPGLIDRDGDGVPETPSGQVPNPNSPFFGNFGDAWGQAFGFDFLTYNVALSVQIPLRNRSNDGQLAQVSIAERQLLSRLKNLQQMIIVDVRNSYQGIETQRKRLEAARVARQLSEEQLAGETKRFEAGLSTNFEVLRYQRDLAEAQVRELRALIDYQLALTALQKATYTIVDDNDIVVAKREN